MKFVTSILATVGFLGIGASQAYASPVADNLPHPVAPLTYISPVVPNEETMTLKGGVQETYSQVKDLTGSLLHPGDLHENHSAHKIKPRSKTSLNCHPQGGPADVKRIRDGIKYLSRLTSTCRIAGRTCDRVSCSWSSGIFICNDTTHTISIPCRDIASYAQDILDTCASPNVITVRGQEFDSEGFNIIVRKGGC